MGTVLFTFESAFLFILVHKSVVIISQKRKIEQVGVSMGIKPPQG
jgi:hypothetical protein